jgi:ankyrin repeat protein
MASGEGNMEIVKLLLENSADINAAGATLPAILVAASNGHINVVKLMLEKGAIVNLKDEREYEAVMNAAHNGHLQVVKLLMSEEETQS